MEFRQRIIIIIPQPKARVSKRPHFALCPIYARIFLLGLPVVLTMPAAMCGFLEEPPEICENTRSKRRTPHGNIRPWQY